MAVQNQKSELKRHSNGKASFKDVIVQPTWSGKAEIVDSKNHGQVKVTSRNLKEAAAIRAEINQAVTRDSYAIADASKSQNVKKFEASLTMQQETKQDLFKPLVGVATASQESEMLGSSGSDELGSSTPNVVTSNIANDDDDDDEFDISKLQSLELNKRRNREALILKSIEEDFSFELGLDVYQWQHISHAGQDYFIGRRDTDLLIINPESYPPKYDKIWVVDMSHDINHLETFSYWNSDKQYQESLIVVASNDTVIWYRINPESQEVEWYWDWLIGNTIRGINYFHLDGKDYLFICSNQTSSNVNIYQFQLANKEFWINQRLELKHPCNEVTLLDTGRDVILAIAQNNTALIYTFNPHEAVTNQMYFQIKKSIAAKGILTIAGFKMGGRSYLALTGYQPQILLYQQGDFIAKTILDSNFGLVELFFPLPVRTYRDDLLLLVQHTVAFDSHSVAVVEILIWDGEAFEISLPVPCHIGSHVVYGATCLLDSHRKEGLKGATFLKQGDNVTLLVPRYKAESGLFHFHTELLAKNSDLLDLQEIFTFLKDLVDVQDQIVQQAEAFLKMPDDMFMPKLEALEALKAPEFSCFGEVQEIYLNDYKWLQQDSDMDFETIVRNVEELEQALNSERQRRSSLEDEYHENLVFDEVWAEDLEVETVNGQPFFIQNGSLVFKGQVEFMDLVPGNHTKDFEKRQLNKEEEEEEGDLYLKGNLEFESINGMKWQDLIDNIVFRTQPQNFQELVVEGVRFFNSSWR